MAILSIRLSQDLDTRLSEESRAARQPKSLLARTALEQFLARQRRERLRERLARAAGAIDGRAAAALAAEALPLDNEALELVERQAPADEPPAKPGTP